MRHLSLAMAGWIRYLGGVDEQGQEIQIEDPSAVDFQPMAKEILAGSATVQPFLAKAFGDKLASSDLYCDLVSQDIASLKADGVIPTIENLLK